MIVSCHPSLTPDPKGFSKHSDLARFLLVFFLQHTSSRPHRELSFYTTTTSHLFIRAFPDVLHSSLCWQGYFGLVTAYNLLANFISFHFIFSNNRSAHVATYNNIKVLEGYTNPVCLSDAQCFYGINIHVSWKQSSRLSTFLLSHWEYEPCLIVCLLQISNGSVSTSAN